MLATLGAALVGIDDGGRLMTNTDGQWISPPQPLLSSPVGQTSHRSALSICFLRA